MFESENAEIPVEVNLNNVPEETVVSLKDVSPVAAIEVILAPPSKSSDPLLSPPNEDTVKLSRVTS